MTIPFEIRPLNKKIAMSPGPGSYETEHLTSLVKKIEDKNQIKTTFSDVSSLISKKSNRLSKGKHSPVGVNRYQNVKSRYASTLLEISNRIAAHTKKPTIFESES